MNVSSKSKDAKSDLEIKLDLFQNKSTHEIKKSENEIKGIFVDRNKHTHDNIKLVMKIAGACKENENKEEIENFKWSNARNYLNTNDIESKVDYNKRSLQLVKYLKNHMRHTEEDFF